MVKKAQKLNPLKKGLLALIKKLWYSSGTSMRALAASALTMVAWLEHRHHILLLLTPLLRQIHKMLKKAKTKMTTISEASRRPLQHFLVLNDKGREIPIKAGRPSSFVFSYVLSRKTRLSGFAN
jgi:hypothetical protein